MQNKHLNLKIGEPFFHTKTASNEIKIITRTLENNTHEVIEDAKLKRITSWRKSEIKFKKSLILNIITFGIVHIISLFYPNIYIKLYCIPSPVKECDFFLVENIYGKLTLCERIYKKNKNNNNTIKEKVSQLNINNNKFAYNDIIKNVTYSFEYNSCFYEYDEKNNEVIPIYMNLSKLMNKDIFNYFSDGLSSEALVKLFRDKFGKNEYKLNIKLLYLFFMKNQIPSLAIVIIIGFIEFICLKNYLIMIIKLFLAIGILIIQLIYIKIAFMNKYSNDFTLDGKNNKSE